MPNKTLYVKDSDLPVWDRAEKLALTGVSSLVTMLLKTHVDQHPAADEQGMITITVECRHRFWAGGYSTAEAHPLKKSFVGRWLIPPEEKLTQEYSSTESPFLPEFFAVALTKKGAIAVYEGDDTSTDGWAELNHYRTFEEFREAQRPSDFAMPDDQKKPAVPRYPDNVIAAVAAALQRDYVVHLDI
jgi:hypothetical protein